MITNVKDAYSSSEEVGHVQFLVHCFGRYVSYHMKPESPSDILNPDHVIAQLKDNVHEDVDEAGVRADLEKLRPKLEGLARQLEAFSEDGTWTDD